MTVVNIKERVPGVFVLVESPHGQFTETHVLKGDRKRLPNGRRVKITTPEDVEILGGEQTAIEGLSDQERKNLIKIVGFDPEKVTIVPLETPKLNKGVSEKYSLAVFTPRHSRTS